MEKNNFWNGAAKEGLILGAVLSASWVFELVMSLSGKFSNYMLMGIEALVIMVVHYYLLHRYVHRRAMLFSAAEGFSFRRGYSYLMAVSGFAGILVGVTQSVALHMVLGYSVYLERYLSTLQNVLASKGAMSTSMSTSIYQLFEQLRTAPAPSALETVWSGVLTSLLFGAIFGLIIAGVHSRAPQPVDKPDNNA